MHTTPLRAPARPARLRRVGTVAAISAALALSLSACGSTSDTGSDTGSDAAPASADTTALGVSDPWVKSADSGMTAAFGTLTNDGDQDVVVTGVTSEASPTMELHETVAGDGGAMQMQEKQGGFTVPAGGELELTPGGNHLMLMDVSQPLRPGEEVTFTLDLEGGGTQEFSAVVKDFSGADEKYAPGHGS
ncbi:copper chaperone PCu(A)C [Nocardioides marmoraquaticus]